MSDTKAGNQSNDHVRLQEVRLSPSDQKRLDDIQKTLDAVLVGLSQIVAAGVPVINHDL